MIEAYKVGVDIAMTSNVTPALEKIAKQMADLDKIIKGTREGIKGISADLAALGSASAAIGRLASELGRIGRGRSGLSGEMSNVVTATERAIAVTERLGSVMERNARLAAETASVMNGGGGRRSAAGGHDLMLTGIAASMVGGGVNSFYATAVKSGMDLGHLKAIMGADDRVTKEQIARAGAQASAASGSVPGSTITGNMGLILDLKQVTGSMDDAIAAMPTFAKLVTTLEAIDRRSGGSGDAGFAAAKAVEILGRMTVEDPNNRGHHIIDPAELARNVALITQVAVGTNGRVDPAAYLTFAKQARVGGMALNDKALFRDLPALLMVQGGSRAGTGEAATYQQFINGTMTKQTAEMLKKYGLLDKDAKWSGGRVQDMAKHFKGAGEFAGNPVDWVRDVLIPTLEKMGITDPVKQAQAVSQFSGRQTTAGFLGEIARAIAAIDKESGNLAHTRMDSFEMLQANDPSQALRNFDAAWHNLLTTLGDTASGDAVAVLKALTNAIDEVAAWARKNPDVAEKLMATAAGLGAIASAVGVLATAVFLFGPALKLLGIGGAAAGEAGAAAGGGEAAAAVGGAAAAASGLLPWILKRSGLISFLWPNTSIQSEADEMKALRQALGLPPGTGPVARGVMAPSAVGVPPSSPPPRSGPVDVRVINGRDLVNGVTSEQARQMNRAQAGYAEPDGRISPGYHNGP
jgi:hypothetical protein